MPCVLSGGEVDASDNFLSCAFPHSDAQTHNPPQPSKSDFVLSTYWSIPPCYKESK